jgi:16S rRNA (guanine(966)-N(2))-methyltransferase RsmD
MIAREGVGLRVTGGTLRGRVLRAPRGAATRPTADRVRQSLFARLGDLSGAGVLDLFAGTGALGIEALSRGAARAVFAERARPALASLDANLRELGLGPASRVLRGEVGAALRRLAREREHFDLILLDPPYGTAELSLALREVVHGNLLAPEGTLVLETSWRHPPGDVPGLQRRDERRYGETLVVCYALGPADSASEKEPSG